MTVILFIDDDDDSNDDDDGGDMGGTARRRIRQRAPLDRVCGLRPKLWHRISRVNPAPYRDAKFESANV